MVHRVISPFDPGAGVYRLAASLYRDASKEMPAHVPTAITGFYGQNVLYPGINTLGGFVTSTAVIVVIVITLYRMFRQARLVVIQQV